MSEKMTCDACKREIEGHEYLSQINPEGGYGMPRFLACDECVDKAEPGSIIANYRERHPR